jgi:hypothetical protein
MVLTPQAFNPAVGDWVDDLQEERAAWTTLSA